MKKFCFIVLLLLTVVSFTFAEKDKQVFMVYGNDFMVNISLPDYWQVDMDFAYQNGINGFFFLKEIGIQKSPVGIILTLVEKPTNSTKIQDYIDYDKNELLNYYTENIFSEIKLNNQKAQKYGYQVRIFEFRNKNNLIHYQNIAYIDCNAKYFIKLYIDCKNKNGTEKYIQDHIESILDLNYMNITLDKN